MKTIYNGQKIVTNNDTNYIGESTLNLTLSSGVHKFIACGGTITITSASVIVFAEQSPLLQITNTIGAKTYRGDYAIGDIFITANADSPATRFGGTWEKLASDAYFKIVTSGAGTYGGTSSAHKIPIASIPSHGGHVANNQTHYIKKSKIDGQGGNSRPWIDNLNGNELGISTQSFGNGQSYYPYYYGVYAWRRSSYQNKE